MSVWGWTEPVRRLARLPRPEQERPRGQLETRLREARLPTVIEGAGWREFPWRLPLLRVWAILVISAVVMIAGLALFAVLWDPEPSPASTEPTADPFTAFAFIIMCGAAAAVLWVPLPSRPAVAALGALVALAYGTAAAVAFRYPTADVPDSAWGEAFLEALLAFAVSVVLLLCYVPQLVASMIHGIWKETRQALGFALAHTITPLVIVIVVPLARDPWDAARRLDAHREQLLLGFWVAIVLLFALRAAWRETRDLVFKPPGHDGDALASEIVRDLERCGSGEAPTLPRRAKLNVAVNVATFVLLRITVVTLTLFLVLALFTLLVSDTRLVEAWSGGTPDALWQPFGVQLYETQALLCAVLAGVGGLAFAATALGEDARREEFIAPERARIAEALGNAWLYRAGMSSGLWRPQPGWTWSTPSAFTRENRLRRKKSHTVPLYLPADPAKRKFLALRRSPGLAFFSRATTAPGTPGPGSS